MSAEPLSVALLTPDRQRVVNDLGAGLVSQGHRARLITSHRGWYRRSIEDGLRVTRHWRPPEPWTLRNIEPGLSHLPFTYASLRVNPPDVAHAFHPTDALAARRWSQRGGGPFVFSAMGQITREGIAAKRLRRTILEQAICEAAAVTAVDTGARDALWRWFGVEAEVVDPDAGVDQYLTIYRELLAG